MPTRWISSGLSVVRACVQGSGTTHVSGAHDQWLSAAGLLLLNRRARHCAVGTEQAAIALFGAHHDAAAGALVEKLAGSRGHRLTGLLSELRACQGAE